MSVRWTREETFPELLRESGLKLTQGEEGNDSAPG
jgi:hypothetical protein